MASNTPWAQEHVDALLRLHGTGMAYSTIGLEIGKTKSAVSGMASRLGLSRPLRASSTGERGRGAKVVAKTSKLRPVTSKGNLRGTKVIPVKRKLDLTPSNGKCQFMQSESYLRDFCGARTVNHSSWCEEHFRRVYTCKPPSKKA